MVQGINNLQIGRPTSWSGLTTDTHLQSIGERDVQLYSDIMTQLFNLNNNYGLDNMLSKYPTHYLDTDAAYKWYLKGDDRETILITGFTAVDSTRPGVAHSTFKLRLEKRYYQKSDYVIFDNRDFGVLILDDGEAVGTNWEHTVQMMTGDQNAFIPPVLLQSGRRVSKQNNADTNVLGRDYGGVEYSSHFEMRNELSTGSKIFVVPGNLYNAPLTIGFKTPDGETIKVWTRYQEIKAEWQYRCEKAKRMIFDRSNQNPDGTFSNRSSAGFVIKQGSGLREQISPSYKFFFNNLTLDFIYEVCLNLSLNILPEDKREFVIMTGERGMIKFHRLIEQNVALLYPFGNEKRLGGSGQALELTGQYIRFKGPQGIVITVMHMPEYDDPIDNRLPHPDGGFTENYRMTIMNIGTTNGNPNIQKISVKGREDLRWYIPGSTSPYGPLNGKSGASKVDGYEVCYRYTQGIVLKNPLSAAELIPNILV
ncbi:MAG: hypothetical protein EKK64_02470 [Neisseriaceae bacterium]|nr:MAG: hypothetical protein EKK64_02470 [Neisseriaceae bacterium]